MKKPRKARKPVAALAADRQSNPPRRASSEWLVAEIERAAGSCTDPVTVRHLRAIITALSR